MNSAQKQVIASQLSDEEKVINDIRDIYEQAAKDVSEKIRILDNRSDIENLASIIYQKQYQENIRLQIDSVLDLMNGKQFTRISEYLNDSYYSGYIGQMFDLFKQDIPMILPIDQTKVVKAITLDSKISEGLYKKLGVDTAKLKTEIRKNVSRTVASGGTYMDVANHINRSMKIGMNKSIRIARTEGHRVQNEASFDAMHDAKDNGADIVKQWDAAIDKRTRPAHAKVDGEIRELDEPFSNGLMYPSDPNGSADQVINCRCALLQRAKWALDDEELQILKDRAEQYKQLGFDVDKNDSFDEFRQKYIDAVKTDPNIGNTDGIEMSFEKEKLLYQNYKSDTINKKVVATDLDKDLQNVLYKYTDGYYKDICDYSQYLVDKSALWHRVDFYEDNILPELSDETRRDTERLLELISKQPKQQNPLYRIERGVHGVSVGDEVKIGIRSATRDPDFVDNAFKGLVEGFEGAFGKFDGNYTEYRFISSRSLDISAVSAYKAQEEELVSGSFNVVKIDKIENIRGGWQTNTLPMREVAQNIEPFTSKTGKNMVRYEYDGKQMSDTIEKFNSRTVDQSTYREPQIGRTIVWLEAK